MATSEAIVKQLKDKIKKFPLAYHGWTRHTKTLVLRLLLSGSDIYFTFRENNMVTKR